MVADTRENAPLPDLWDAIGHAMMHRAAFADLHGLASNTSTIQDDGSNDVVFAELPARQTYIRNSRANPMSCALLAEGAGVVDKTEFRIAHKNGALGTPLASLSFEVW